MCGVAGYWNRNRIFDNSEDYLISKSLRHRGPDDFGVWKDKKKGIALIHTRLSILDLSSAGHQPMQSNCGRYIISYNGEIYNHLDIRKELKNYSVNTWKSQSDTETLLIALKVWGLDKTLKKINGMFAFALWDNKNGTLVLARDRIGEKPIYYGFMGGTFIFASELKALKKLSVWNGEIDQDALSLYLRFNYVPAPRCIFKNMYKLKPAHYIVLNENNYDKMITQKRYWDISNDITNNLELTNNQFEETKQNLLSEIRKSVSRRMISDVPIGSFLSGGFDSTLITAIMQEQSLKPINTFSVGFFDKNFNEATYAKKISKILGTNHHEIYVNSKNALDVIPKLPEIYCEPFADISQIPTYLISKFASDHVKVCLSGDGGDEIYCGYNRYLKGPDIFKLFNKLPKYIKQFCLTILSYPNNNFWQAIQNILFNSQKPNNFASHMSKLLIALKYSDEKSYYLSLISNPKNLEEILINPKEFNDFFKDLKKIKSFREKMMFMDINNYLPDDILTKVDRASMANSLEVRAPFLDHHLLEMSLKIPIDFKYRNNHGKWILKELVYKYVPKKIMDRPKKGFDVPISDWLRGPLKEWAYDLLNDTKFADEDLFNLKEINKMWEEHQSGKINWQSNLWSILMFKSWQKFF